MPEEKTKVKDLAVELGVPSKDMLRALRDLNVAARTTAAWVGQEDVGRLRDYFAQRKNDTVERIAAQDVIVRRRRKEASREKEPRPEPQAAAVKAEKPEPASKKPKAAELPSEESVKLPEAPKVEAPQSAQTLETRPSAGGKNSRESAANEKSFKKNLRVVDARVISRPGDQKPEPEIQKKPAPKKEARSGKTLAEEIREREAAKAREEAAKAAPAKAAVERPAAEAKKMESAVAVSAMPAVEPESLAVEAKTEQAEKSSRAARLAAPDASAVPAGSSAPNLARRQQTESGEAEPESGEAGARSGNVPPQVRIISRPVPSAGQSAARQKTAQAPGRSGGHRGQEQRTSQNARSGSNYRSGSPRMPGFGASGGLGRPVPGQPMPGQEQDGRDGQSKKKRLKGRRTVDFQQGDFGRHAEEDENIRFNRGKSRRKSAKIQPQPQKTQPVKAAKRKIRVAEAIRVADMAHQLGIKANEIIKVLLGLGVMATINQSLDIDTATLVAAEFGYEVEKAGFSEEDYLAPGEADAPESLKPRPPVVTIMGHVDHGKTSLLDAVRKTNVTSGEAGGITQHIGAYHVKTKRGEIVFLDTPGHEAFTAMRARGAQITDLVILVVAADDGVMEQTREAINHARAANVPIVVAVNKMDKPGADPDRVLRELSELGLQPEDWGGDTIVARVSAKTREGLDDLLELVALQSEIMDLKANPDRPARGHIVEAKLDKGRGPIATVLIQSGTLRQGDNFVCGPFAGRVRALTSDQGKKVKEAGPSIPVEVQGFDGVPEAGEEFLVVADDKLARRIADSRAIKRRERDLASEARVTLETFLAHHGDQEALNLNLVLKADVQGSLEAIGEALRKQSTEKVKIGIVHGGTGAISESDILLAAASKAIIIGFNVRPTARIKDIAERENVDVRFYDIIYKLVDDVKSAMAGLLAPVQREVYLGQAEVRKLYTVPKVGVIAGSYVSDGRMSRNASLRLLRDGVVVYTGKIASLKRHKDDAREVVKGNECGISLENFQDIKEGDIIEAFETVEEAATL